MKAKRNTKDPSWTAQLDRARETSLHQTAARFEAEGMNLQTAAQMHTTVTEKSVFTQSRIKTKIAKIEGEERTRRKSLTGKRHKTLGFTSLGFSALS